MLELPCCSDLVNNMDERASRVAELEAHAAAAGSAQGPAVDEAALREIALLRSRVLELEAACPTGTPDTESARQRSAADAAALCELALLRSRVLELEAAWSAETPEADAAAPQQVAAPCSRVLELDATSDAGVPDAESAACRELAALRSRVLELEAAQGSVQALEGAVPWCPASADGTGQAGPLAALPEAAQQSLSGNGVQSEQVALCPCYEDSTALKTCREDRCCQDWRRLRRTRRSECWS